MSRPSEAPEPADLVHAVKVVVAGGFGVGKTTFVGSVSEVRPLTTEMALTDLGEGVDRHADVLEKTTTTVAMDFGRITIDPHLVLYLFGTPGQERFGFLWDDLADGAAAAVVLVDTRRVDDSFGPIDFFESRNIPFAVGVNPWDGAPRFPHDEIRDALGIARDVPLVSCDARVRDDVKQTLVAALRQAASRLAVAS